MITIRQALLADAGEVGALVDALLVELSGRESRLGERQALASVVLAPGSGGFGLIALDEGRAVGVLMLTEGIALHANGRFGTISELYVRPEARSLGVARQLLSAAEDFAREHDWGQLEVGAPRQPQWSRSLAFYLREGFTEVGPRLKKLVP